MADNELDLLQVLTFNLGDSLFAIDIATVREIIPSGVMTHVPLMPTFIRGIINLRGTVVPVIDLQSRFGWSPGEVSKKTCIVIIESNSGAGPNQIGLMVDSVSEVIEVLRTDIEPPPNFGTPIRHDLIEGMIKMGDSFLIILKPSHAFDMEVLTKLVDHEETV
jgi:purine-binding chemotaxis protein CheW